MKERELGTMQIANDRIRIVETGVVDPENICRPPFIHGIGHIYRGNDVMCEWFALVPGKESPTAEKVIGWAALIQDPAESETVFLWGAVSPDYGRTGLGKLMLRFGTDQAIRYRKRTIFAEVEAKNAVALHILDIEEFEIQPEAHPGFVLLKKELKWI